jgi:hypothetical protein
MKTALPTSEIQGSQFVAPGLYIPEGDLLKLSGLARLLAIDFGSSPRTVLLHGQFPISRTLDFFLGVLTGWPPGVG